MTEDEDDEDIETTPDISAENVARMLEGVSPQPWFHSIDDYQGNVDVYVDYRVILAQKIIHSQKIGVYEFGDAERIANARFIAWARSAIPVMSDALKAAEAENEKLRDALKRFRAEENYRNAFGEKEADIAIGKRIRMFRKFRNMRLEELGAYIGVSTSTICQYETGRKRPTAGRLLAIANALQFSIEDFSLGREVTIKIEVSDDE